VLPRNTNASSYNDTSHFVACYSETGCFTLYITLNIGRNIGIRYTYAVVWYIKRWWPSSIVYLSVCLSHIEIGLEGHCKLKIGRTEACGTDDPWSHSKGQRSKVKVKVKVTRTLNVVTENQPYLRNGKAYKVQTDLQAFSLEVSLIVCDCLSVWLFKSSLSGAATHCGGRNYIPHSLF